MGRGTSKAGSKATPTKTPAQIVNSQRSWNDKNMKEFDINGKRVVTNYGSAKTTYYASYSYRPNIYSKEVRLNIMSNRTVADVFNELVEQGYNRIMVLQGHTGMVIADSTYLWAGKDPKLM